jgi:glycosyltransferase involved in cell wall biosynthesis
VSPPSFSVVVAAYDSAATIGETIESVRGQTRSDWELIVVDDGSQDGTVEVAQAFADPRVRVIRSHENRGPAAARNRAILLAQAPLICTLDSDDLWLPGYLETMARALESAPGASVASTDAWVLDEATGRVGKTSVLTPQDPPHPFPDDTNRFLSELLQRNFVYNSVAVKREALLAVGGYDERLWVGEDWELWLRLAAGGFRFVCVPQLLAVYRVRAGSLTSDPERLLAARREIYRILAEEWAAGEEIRDLALKLRRDSELRVQRRAAVATVLGPLLELRHRFTESMRWRREPPQDVADLLQAVAATRQG